MKATIVCYSLDKLSPLQKLEVHRTLNGYTDYSNNAKYTYEREGILAKIPHHKPIRGVILIETKNKSKVLNFFNKYKIKYKTFNTSINRSMLY